MLIKQAQEKASSVGSRSGSSRRSKSPASSRSKRNKSKARQPELIEDDMSDDTKKAIAALDDPKELERLLYIDNADGLPDEVNNGYTVMPLNAKIYGKKKVQAQLERRKRLK